MKRIALLLAACGAFYAGHAQIPVTGGTLTYTQNFDALDTTVYSSGNPGSSNLPTGWTIFEYGTSTTRANNLYVGDYGSINTGDTYSYGSTGSTERALGSLASGSVASHYGARFVNNSGAPITGFTIKYRGEQWRMGSTGRTNEDSLRFFYSTTATDVNDTAASKWTLDNGLTLTTPNMGATVGALDGNLATNSKAVSGTIATTIPAGGTLVIRWFDPNVAGADDGLAIDSFSITFTLGGAPSPKPSLVSHTPASNATGVAPNTMLTMTFDKAVTAGTGSIYLKNRMAQTTNTIPANASNVSISGKTVTINGLTLDNGAMYHVTFDSTAFDSASYNSYGLYDTTAWMFTVASSGVQQVRSATLPLTVINPALNGAIALSCTMPQAAVLTARVYDLNGRVLISKTFNAAKGDNRFSLQTSLPAGTYMIHLDDGKEWGSVKVTMQ